MNVVKGVGVARPPQQNMRLKIVIWVAELIIELLKANRHDLARQVEDSKLLVFKKSQELEELRHQQELLSLSISTVKQHNSVLEEQIRLAKITLGELKTESRSKTAEQSEALKIKIYTNENNN